MTCFALKRRTVRGGLVLLREFRVGRGVVSWAAAVCGRSGRARASRRSGAAARAAARRGSGCRPGFRAPAFEGEKGVGDRHTGDVVMPAAVGAAFEVSQAEGVLEFAVVVLDAPAELGEPD